MRKILSCLIILLSMRLHAQVITTVAGDGTYGYAGNGGPALQAKLGWQMAVATDRANNIYICDHDNNAIRKVDAAGIITNYAGTSVLGYTGDGGPATAATLYHPAYMAFDAADNLYFMDQNAAVVRRIDAVTGIITSITRPVWTPTYSGDGGQLIDAYFGSVAGIAFDATGNMYLSDYYFSVIRKVDLLGIVTTVAGTGTAGFSGDGGPATAAKLDAVYGVKFDRAGNMYVPDARNRRVRKINTAGIISTVAGNGTNGYSGDGGPATAAAVGFPWTIALDQNDNLYIGDGSVVVRKVATDGIITTYAGNGIYGNTGDGGPATDASLGYVSSLFVDNNNDLLISVREYFNVIRKVSTCNFSIITDHPKDVALCNSGNANFSVTVSNPGTYQWQVNTGSGWSNLANSATYAGATDPALYVTGVTTSMNDYRYRCAILNGCGTVYSTEASLKVTTPASPAIGISSSVSQICAGENVQFSASAVLGGTNPVYQWKKNGIPVGTNANSYTDNALLNGDKVTCTIISSATCLNTTTAVSNEITITVRPIITPTISIDASQLAVCAGSPVTFNATITDGGATPALNWYRNGNVVATNTTSFSASNLSSTDNISCELKSSLGCLQTPAVTSNTINIAIAPTVTPTVTIATSTPAICPAGIASFTSSVFNGGTAAQYEWLINGNSSGIGTSTFQSSTLTDGDRITCRIVSNANCVISPVQTSNPIAIKVFPQSVVKLDQTATLCEGATRILDAGNFTSYQWNDGSAGRTYTVRDIGNYSVIVQDANGCSANGSTAITKMLDAPAGFVPRDTFICSYGDLVLRAQPYYTSYYWSSGANTQNLTITSPGTYELEVTNREGCTGKEHVVVSPKECLLGFYMPTAFTPNGDGKNDLLKPNVLGNILSYQFSVFNRWGERIFHTNNASDGWNGFLRGKKQDSDVFVWQCTYQFQGEAVQHKSGTVVLIR